MRAGALRGLRVGRYNGCPAAQMGLDDVSQCRDAVWAVVQAGQVVEFAAALGQKGRLAFQGDFFEGFQTVGNETGADHIDALDTFACQFFQRRLGLGL